jgi:hypothetical protein
MAEETEQERDKRQEQENINKRKARLKQSAGNIDGSAKALAIAITNASGNTLDGLQDFIEDFQTGYVEQTPDPNDTPYGMPRGLRPKVTIVRENLPRKSSVVPPKTKS